METRTSNGCRAVTRIPYPCKILSRSGSRCQCMATRHSGGSDSQSTSAGLWAAISPMPRQADSIPRNQVLPVLGVHARNKRFTRWAFHPGGARWTKAITNFGWLRLEHQRGFSRGTGVCQLERTDVLGLAPVLEENQSCLRKGAVSLRKNGLLHLLLHRAL